ncbi:MAG: LysR family transcriptional regulator [Firmicutes bacterium]|nr:LysR family transcriptional regulator [Bacillota bacterium]
MANKTNLNLYRTFLAVYETRSVRKASELTGTTHSAVSQNLKELGKQLGVALFTPLPRGMEPSSYADSLYPTIRSAIDTIDGGEKNVRTFNENTDSVIKIICTTNFAGYYLTPYIAMFRDRYPNIKFDILNKSIDDAAEWLERGATHLVLSVVPLEKFPNFGFKQIELQSFPQTFFTTAEFAKANKIEETISKEKFNTLPFLALRTVGYFVKNIKEPDIVVDMQENIIQLVAKSAGVSFGILSVAKETLGEDILVGFEVEGHKPKDATLVCAYSAKIALPKAVSAFLTLLKA